MDSQRVKRSWMHTQIRRIYFQHFQLLLLILIASLLVLGIFLIERALWAACSIAFVLLLTALSYYAIYIRQYRNLTDAYFDEQYYLKIFSFWGICAFNAVFIACFAFIGLMADRLFPFTLFENTAYEDVLLYFLQTAINGAFFGFLDTFNINLCTLQSGACKFEPGIYASLYAYAVAVTLDVTFLTAVKDELSSRRDAIFDLIDLVKINQPKRSQPTAKEIKVMQMILGLISAGNLDTSLNERMLVETLKRSKQKKTRSVYLDLMQSTEDMVVFQACLEYFKENEDSRFRNVAKRIHHPRKRALLEDFEYRRVKKKKKK